MVVSDPQVSTIEERYNIAEFGGHTQPLCPLGHMLGPLSANCYKINPIVLVCQPKDLSSGPGSVSLTHLPMGGGCGLVQAPVVGSCKLTT